MKVVFEPSSAEGTLVLPPSKSYSHRALICALLGGGVSRIFDLSLCDDVAATAECIKNFGAKISSSGEYITVESPREGGRLRSCTLDCRESASTLRFLLPVSLLYCETADFRVRGSLSGRPVDPYLNIFAEKNVSFSASEDGYIVSGTLSSGDYTIDSSVSSQFASGLLLALSAVEGESRLILTGKTVSSPYIGLTVDVLRAFGARIVCESGVYHINGGFMKSADICVPGDASALALLELFNSVGGSVDFKNPPDDKQGDAAYKKMFEALACGFETVDVSQTPDLAPALAVLGALHNGCRLTGIENLKYKESDRLASVEKELKKFSARVSADGGSFTVHKVALCAPREEISSHGDHRIAMAFAPLCAKFGGTLDGAESVGKSYPGYFEELSRLGVRWRII